VRKNNKRKIAATIAITAILVGGGGAAAIAYWSAGGSGTGSAATGTSQAINVTQSSTVTGLAPGSAAQTLGGTFTTTNPGKVYVASVAPSITKVATPAGVVIPGCTTSDYSLTAATINAEVGTGDTWTGATIAFNDKPSTNQDLCKNAVLTITYAVS
jgi:hypothetical protein